jgi:outer membrane protein
MGILPTCIRVGVFFLLVAIATAAPAQQDAATQPGTLTLERAVALALQDNVQIKIASREVEKAQDQLLAMRTERLPRFDVYFLGSYLLTPISVQFNEGSLGEIDNQPVPSENKQITTNPKPSATFIGQVKQPLSQLYRINLGVGEQAVDVKLQQEILRSQKQSVTNSVKETYYGLVQTQSGIEAAQENVKALEEMDRTTDEYLAQKSVLSYQSLGVKAQLAQAQLQLVTLQDNFATQEESLNSLLNRDVRTEFTVTAVPDELPEETDISAARTAALQNRTEIHQALLKIDQANYDVRVEKSLYIPDVSASFNYFSPFTIQGFPRNIVSAGFLVQWDVFDWGYKRHILEQKRRTVDETHLNLDQTQSQVVVDVDNRYRKLREARANLRVAQLARYAEKEKLRVVLEEYKQKAALLSTAQQEQATWAQTSAQYSQALAAFWTARADFEKAMGEE